MKNINCLPNLVDQLMVKTLLLDEATEYSTRLMQRIGKGKYLPLGDMEDQNFL